MSQSKSPAFSVREFFARFPNDDACLAHLMNVRYGGLRFDCPGCGVESTFNKLANRRAFSCSHCGHHVYPTAGTIMHDTRTPLVSWFYAIYLFVTTRHGVSGKELQRQLGVTYKTAWRMGQQIRDLMTKADMNVLLTGHIEADEAYIGGRRVGGKRGRGAEGKTIVFGLKERGGPIATTIIPNVKKATLRKALTDRVEGGSIVSTDELVSYGLLKEDGYHHGRVRHNAKEWASVDKYGIKHSTNAVENFWRLFKNSIRSTHIHVSQKYMERYLGEFTFRANYRDRQNAMFDLLVGAL